MNKDNNDDHEIILTCLSLVFGIITIDKESSKYTNENIGPIGFELENVVSFLCTDLGYDLKKRLEQIYNSTDRMSDNDIENYKKKIERYLIKNIADLPKRFKPVFEDYFTGLDGDIEKVKQMAKEYRQKEKREE